MDADCLPISAMPGTSALFRAYAEHAGNVRQWFPTDPFSMAWASSSPHLGENHRERLAVELRRQAEQFHSAPAALANIQLLRTGAAAVVTGQQVGLLGGPLLTLFKAATAIRKAQEATKATGRPHVPIFWMATEDHDIAEVDDVVLLSKTGVEHRGVGFTPDGAPVGGVPLTEAIDPVLAWAEELLAYAPITEVLRAAYDPADGATLATAFGRLLSHVFAEQGLIVLDASGRECHALGASVLKAAIERADELEAALLQRSAELEAAGFHAQVKVDPTHSLLFLVTVGGEGHGIRQALRRDAGGVWKAGAQTFSTPDLLAIAETEPERLSPNALLRPVFQDALLPTVAYIGGPAEIAYFAQSAVVYQALLGRVTPVLPRLSATLIEPAVAQVMATHEVSVPQVWEVRTAETLALRLGARAIPIEGKRRIAAVGNALDAELGALRAYAETLSADLGRSAGISASKMSYQMNRLRRMIAAFEVQKEASLGKHASAIVLSLFPEAHLQERLLSSVWFLARHGDTLPALLVANAGQECPGHRVIRL